MATSKKPAVKKAANVTSPVQPTILKIEDNIPVPERGMRDPMFMQQVGDLLKKIKPSQSFIVPKVKLYSVKRMAKNQFEHMVVRGIVIKPEEKFARIWRVK
jgi:hypothetical protein